MNERRRLAGSWIGGVRAAGVDLGRPGERLGLPAEGPGSVAGYGRRLLALIIDWVIALALSGAASAAWRSTPQTRSLITLAVFGAMVWLSIGLAGASIGKRLCGLRVARTGGGRVGPLRALVRTVLLLVVVPALMWDRDYRGLHDRAADTVVVHR